MWIFNILAIYSNFVIGIFLFFTICNIGDISIPAHFKVWHMQFISYLPSIFSSCSFVYIPYLVKSTLSKLWVYGKNAPLGFAFTLEFLLNFPRFIILKTGFFFDIFIQFFLLSGSSSSISKFVISDIISCLLSGFNVIYWDEPSFPSICIIYLFNGFRLFITLIILLSILLVSIFTPLFLLILSYLYSFFKLLDIEFI